MRLGKKNSQYKLMPGIWSTHLIDIAPVVQNGAAEVGYTGEGTCRKHTAFHLAGVVMTTVLVPSVPNGLPISGGDPEDQGPGWVCDHRVCQYGHYAWWNQTLVQRPEPMLSTISKQNNAQNETDLPRRKSEKKRDGGCWDGGETLKIGQLSCRLFPDLASQLILLPKR